MQYGRRGLKKRGTRRTTRQSTAAAFEIRLRMAASFPEKLRQLLCNPSTKRAPLRRPFEFHIGRIRG
jgi:hypothetical protein